MTLTTPYSATFIVGDGETKTFSYLFEEVSANFITVTVYNTVSGITSTPTYTVDTDQKQVIFGDDTPAPTADDVVCIYRDTPVIQDVQFRTLHGYDAKTMENILSKIVAMIQEIKSNYLTTDVLQGDPWQIDLMSSADDGATLVIDYVAKKFTKGLYFKITSGNLQVSGDGVTYITMPKSADIAEFRQQQTELPDHTYQYKLQYRVGSTWFDADSTAQNTADAAYNLAQTVQTGLSTHVNNQNNPHQTSVANLTDTVITNPTLGHVLRFNGIKWVNTSTDVHVEWGEIEGTLADQTDLKDALDAKVNIDGTSIMTAPLKFAAGSMRGAVGPYLNGVSFWKMSAQQAITNIANLTDSQFLPVTTNSIDIGRSTNQWKDLHLSGTAYISTINNKYDISVPDYGGTMVVADWGKTVQEGMFLRLDRDLHPIWETVTLTTSLSSLTDVTITSATNGQVLTYDGSKWVNQAVPTPTINYSINGGNYTAGTGTYAITRFSLMLQKANGTWEKPTDTSANYSQATNKTVNTNGFLLNQILYYNNTGGVSGGQLTGLNKVYSKHASVPMSYSTNCGTAPGWALGTWIYLVGTLGADGLFYLDTTQWWSDALPNSADGKLYIRLGPASSSTGDTVALLEDRPIFYHDGNGIKEYHPGGNGGNGGNSNIILSPDIDIVGTLTQNGSVFSGFSSGNYLRSRWSPVDFRQPFEFVIGANFTAGTLNQSIAKHGPTSYGGTFTLLYSGSTGELKFQGGGGDIQISGAVSTGVDYLIKVTWDGSDYKMFVSTDNGATYSQVGSTYTSTTNCGYGTYLQIGKDGGTQYYESFLGTINLAGAYLKIGEEIIWSGMDAPGLGLRVIKGHEVIEFQAPTSGNNYTWYRKYADGWVEQGGVTSGNSNPKSVTFPVEMANTNYYVFGNIKNSTDNGATFTMQPRTLTTTGMQVYCTYATHNDSGGSGEDFYWEVKGMAA